MPIMKYLNYIFLYSLIMNSFFIYCILSLTFFFFFFLPLELLKKFKNYVNFYLKFL